MEWMINLGTNSPIARMTSETLRFTKLLSEVERFAVSSCCAPMSPEVTTSQSSSSAGKQKKSPIQIYVCRHTCMYGTEHLCAFFKQPHKENLNIGKSIQ